LVIPKPKGGYRSCVDLRVVNQWMLSTVDHVRRPEEVFLHMSLNFRVFSEIDLKAAFF